MSARLLTRTSVMALLVVLTALPARAADILTEAKAAPTRAEGLLILERHLIDTPRDVDARLLYGLMLSWEGRYDEARRELGKVLEQTPTYTDARVGLMNVEWWSGREAAAREQVDLILSRDPGQPQARLVKQRLAASSHPWTVTSSVSYDQFSDGRTSWNEQSVSLSRQTGAGSLIVRTNAAARFGTSARQVELEFYPSIRRGTYGFIAIGVAPDRTLYPERRLAFDLYQSLGHGFEVSGGYRRLAFADATAIYVGTLSKYIGNWMFTGKVYHVPARGRFDSTTGHFVAARRYFGGAGTSFVGLGYSQGLSREEVRGAGDLLALDSQTIRGQLDTVVTSRLRLQLEASTSRQRPSPGTPFWQISLGTGLAVRF
jgi:YaiO family outer membrane protein